jgi:hypothetical protein
LKVKTLARTADERRSESFTGKALTAYAERKEAGISRLGLDPGEEELEVD